MHSTIKFGAWVQAAEHGRLVGMTSETQPTPATGTQSGGRQVKPRAEGWTQARDSAGRPKLQFSQPKRTKLPPTHLADLTLEERIAKAE